MKNGKVNVMFTILYIVLVTAMMSWSLTLQMVFESDPNGYKKNEIRMICENIDFKVGLMILYERAITPIQPKWWGVIMPPAKEYTYSEGWSRF